MKEDWKPIKTQTITILLPGDWNFLHTHKHLCRAELLIVACGMLRHWDQIQSFHLCVSIQTLSFFIFLFLPVIHCPLSENLLAQGCFVLCSLLLPSSSSYHCPMLFKWELVTRKHLSHPAATCTELCLQHFTWRCEVGAKAELKSCVAKLDHPLDVPPFRYTLFLHLYHS